MRLFIAVDLDDAVRAAAAQAAGDLERGLARLGLAKRVRWVPAENLHFTLRFIGQVDETMVSRVGDALSPAPAVSVFDTTVAGAGVFPPSGPPRVLWLGVTRGAAELAALQREIEARVTGLGLEREDRPFTAHLTLGRFREPPRSASAETRRVVQALAVGPVSCRIAHVTLYESRLSPVGAQYVALARTRLTE